MSTIYNKSGKKTDIYAAREGFCRQFDFGSDWTEIRLGMYWGVVASTGPDDIPVNETVVYNNYGDLFAFGIKNYDASLPGEDSASRFVGVGTPTAQNTITGITGTQLFVGGATQGRMATVSAVGTSVTRGDSTGNLSNTCVGTDANDPTGWGSFSAVKLVIADRGLATQTITVTFSNTPTIAGIDYYATPLEALMNGATYSGPSTTNVVQWNDGAAAYDIPNAFFLRAPFFNNRLRVACIQAIRYAP